MKKLIFGMGVTGTELARYMIRNGIAFDCFDNRKEKAALTESLASEDFCLFNDPSAPDLAAYDALIVSPGPRQDHPLLLRARQAGLAILAEVEYAFSRQKGKVVGITGSNGKSTTTSLVYHLLAGAGFKTSLCGNIGVPMISRIDEDPNHIYVLELSSFQLENVTSFRPDVALLLNVCADHLDWHGGFDAYEAAKLRIFAQQQAGDLAVVCDSYVHRLPGLAARVAVPSAFAREEGDYLCVGDDFRLSASCIPILGRHNRSNVLFACVAARHLGLSDKDAARILPSFKGLAHRMELVGTLEGRLWINDSKATNVHAAQAAVDALSQPYVLILGGSEKGERFHHLDLSGNPPKAIIAYGETAPVIAQDLAAHAIHEIHLFKDAVLRAHELAGEGGAVLLAPACASFDQFENFEMRGKVFSKIFVECGSKL